MKLCIVQAWGFQNLDGSNLRVYFLIKELIKRGHSLTLINASEEDAKYSEKIFGCKAVSAGVNISRWDSSVKKMYTYSMFIMNARKIVKGMDAELVFGISFLNSMAAIAHPSAKKVAMYVDLMSNYYKYDTKGNPVGYFLYRLGNYLEDITMDRSDAIITITQCLKELFAKKYWNKTHIIPDGVDTQLFNPQVDGKEFRKKLNTENKKVIGYFGAVDPCDGVQYLASVAPLIIKKYPETMFLIVGRGNYLEVVKEMLRKNNTIDHFIFTGWVQNQDVPKYIRSSDICIVPNVKDESIAPLITYRLLEGMASGVTIMATDQPGIREIADDTMVYFTDSSNTQKFSEDIIRIFETPKDEIQARNTRSWERVKKLDWRDIAFKDSNVLEAVLNRPK